LAAEQGQATAQFNLALKYELGQGVAQNYEQAYFWNLLACANEDPIVIKEASKKTLIA